jgi:hypothetical protein
MAIPPTDIRILFTNYDIITYFLNLAFCSEHFNFPKENLNEKLRLFFASIRKNSGEHLKKSTLVNTRYGISKYLKENCGIDITSDIEFSSCKDVFRAVVVDLKKKGFASTDHKPPIVYIKSALDDNRVYKRLQTYK